MICDKCEGTGTVFNPAWARFYAEAGAALQWIWDDARAVRELEAVYFGGHKPPQFVACKCQQKQGVRA